MGDHDAPESNVIQRLFSTEPAVVRGGLVCLTAVIAAITKTQVDPGLIDDALLVYTVVSPAIAGVLIRRKVTPLERVRQAIEAARKAGAAQEQAKMQGGQP